TRFSRDWSSDVCSSDLDGAAVNRRVVERCLLVRGEDPSGCAFCSSGSSHPEPGGCRGSTTCKQRRSHAHRLPDAVRERGQQWPGLLLGARALEICLLALVASGEVTNVFAELLRGRMRREVAPELPSGTERTERARDGRHEAPSDGPWQPRGVFDEACEP